MQQKHFRHTAVLAAAVLAALCAAAPAQAADAPSAPGAADYNAAQKVLSSSRVQDTVSRFLTAAEQHTAPAGADGGTSLAPAVKAPAKAPGFQLRQPVPYFELSPEFVAAKARPTAAQALRVSYLASRVAASDGHQAAVLLAPQGGTHNWQLAGIQDGGGDLSFAEQGTAKAHAFTFTEPQIHAWYRLTAGGSVEPLNKEAAAGLHGRHQVTLAAYQQLVNKRYGDKLPGSRYDRKGYTGGYALAGDDQAAPTAAAPASPAGPASWRPAAYGAAALMTAGTAGALLRRRRRNAM
ncbi:hypothetical protein [Streptomyces orinoci]|uniref:Uncharacterized protein n=1 Tax=Streptomyces orinoci TaxID=67339 RepID=A0ABV3K5K8_STRON|nr:hypothetical protein [Streptomyces orinoci]